MKKLRIICAFALSMAIAMPLSAQIGNLKDVKKNVPGSKKITEAQKDIPSTGKSSESKTESVAPSKSGSKHFLYV